jgi:hypothetical protein
MPGSEIPVYRAERNHRMADGGFGQAGLGDSPFPEVGGEVSRELRGREDAEEGEGALFHRVLVGTEGERLGRSGSLVARL